MKKKIFFIFTLLLICFYTISNNIFAAPYLSDKNEEEVYMEVPGARALCQTDDGFVWIAQYSGLTRYDSKVFETYKEFEENGKKYDIINVMHLTQKDNALYILTYKNLFKYSNSKFQFLLNIDDLADLENNQGITPQFLDFSFDKYDNLLYIASNDGVFKYDTLENKVYREEGTKSLSISEVVYDARRDRLLYLVQGDGVYDQNNKLIYQNKYITELYIYNDTLLIGTTTGLINFDLEANKVAEKQFDMISDQVNTIYYNSSEDMVFVGCEKKGIYCFDAKTFDYSQTSDLANATQLVDIMVDYEGNLWLASNNNSSSGVSIITKNSFVKLLYGDKVWQDEYIKKDKLRTVYAVEKYNNYLYLCLGKSGLVIYDLKQNKIISSGEYYNPIMEAIAQYQMDNGILKENVTFDCRDIEVFNGKLYFAEYGLGLIEYDPNTNNVNIIDKAFLTDEANIESLVEEKPNTFIPAGLVNIRCLRAFDDFLAVGYQSGGIFRYDGNKISVYCTSKSTIYINKDSNGNVVFNYTGNIIKLSNDFKTGTEIKTEKNVEGNRLKFLYDGDRLYYNLNSRLFYSDNNGESKEIVLPFVKGSIVEIAKVKSKNLGGEITDKFLIATTNQVFITDSLGSDNLDSDNKLIDYEVYDSTNGLKAIQSNTSGYYDEETFKYYFQTTDGILVYDFSEIRAQDEPTRIAINSILLDGVSYYGNELELDKNTYRVEFNLSVLGFKPNKGHTIYYKLDGVDNDYVVVNDDVTTISYTNLSGGEYKFHIYAIDSIGQKSNQVNITLTKAKHFYETVWFWILVGLLVLILIGALNFYIIHRKNIIAKKKENELKGITIESIEAIARTIDAKDSYTNGHSIRVGHFSRIIAAELGMKDEELENLYYIALLHDIGKIGIPDAILNKPGRLTDEEFEIMKSHTTKGAKILKDISTIPNIVEGAKYHHEKYGGGGYPEGLKGEEIPYIARIICCADCFDAMATRRVYKDPYPKEKIISEFERCKNTQFDPKMADVVIKLIQEGKLKAE